MPENTSEDIGGQAAHPAPLEEAAGAGRVEVHHKHEPIHGWREFLKEVGIIVLGVLIALGAEQTVQALHWREQVRQTRESLHQEIQADVDTVGDRLREIPCADARLTEIRAILSAHARGRALELLAPLARPRDTAIYVNASSAALAAGALVHMPPKERESDQALYDLFRLVADLQLNERSTWGVLMLLNEQDVLTDADWPFITRAYADARNLNQRFSTGLPGTLKRAAEMGFRPRPIRGRAAVANVCTPILAGST